MPFSAILLVLKFLMFSFLQVCKFTDLQVHNSIDCPYFYGLSVKISDLLHLFVAEQPRLCRTWSETRSHVFRESRDAAHFKWQDGTIFFIFQDIILLHWKV